MFRRKFLLPDLLIATYNAHEVPLDQLLADFNILLVRRVPFASHGPATVLLRHLLADNRSATDKTVRGFDIRSPDAPCGTCHQAYVVSDQGDLTTICDSSCDVYRQLDIDGDHRFFIIASDRSVIDAGAIRDINRTSAGLGLAVPRRRKGSIDRSELKPANARKTRSNGRILSCDASK